jgi:uncharacterized protein (TIGR02145 family)
MKTPATLLALLCIATFAQQKGTFTDTRDGKTYKTTKIGEQVWMAENLNYEAGGKCYGNDPANCDKYGRLYDWNVAMKACPKGWHLPSNKEWHSLINATGEKYVKQNYESVAGRKLKSKSGWDSNCKYYCNGTDELGFSALPGGHNYSGRDFYGAGGGGYWWTATENKDGYFASIPGTDAEKWYEYEPGSRAYYWCVHTTEKFMTENSSSVLYGYSVRCVRN